MSDAQYFGYLIGAFFAFSIIVLSLYVVTCRIIAKTQKRTCAITQVPNNYKTNY